MKEFYNFNILQLFYMQLFSLKVPITPVGKFVGRKFHFQTFLLSKLTEVTLTQESVYEVSSQIPGLTSLLTAKKSMKMKFSADKISYNFFQENPQTL